MQKPSQIEVDTLISQIAQGNEKAFEGLYDSYSPALYGVVLKIVRDEAVAQDVLQEAMVKIWKNIHSFDSKKGSIFTWMLNIARNRAIDELRKMKRSGGGEIQSLSLDVNISNGNNPTIREQEIGIKDLLKKLPAEQMEVMEYLYFQGFTQQEVSDELDLPLGTVKSRARIALRDLRKFFTLLLFWI